jgi:D-alanyl-D-alanine carboxypeptidase
MSNPIASLPGLRAPLAAVLTLGQALLWSPTATAGPALLFDPKSGRVLYAEDPDHAWHPASVTKIMTAYIVFEALKRGRIAMDTKVVVSENALAQPPSKIGMPVGTEITVELALQALIVKSANDVAVMLAEGVGGTEEAFVKLMNDTAKRLGMSRTHFVNPHGLPAAEQVTTARDLARLTRAVLSEFPEHAAYWAQPEVRIGKRRLRSHNSLLTTYEGADGIKTGFICDSGYNVVASATRDGMKLVAIVLGEPSGLERNVRAASLLEHGFQTYGWKQIFTAATLDSMPIVEPKAASSVRLTVAKFECSGRRRPVARTRPAKAKATARAAPAPAAAGAPAAPAVAPARPKPKASTVIMVPAPAAKAQ